MKGFAASVNHVLSSRVVKKALNSVNRVLLRPKPRVKSVILRFRMFPF
ncbi:Uncharacterised protein [Klebsiella variicola]|nr:Uncharacterised protein [Klebsiella variicola]